MHVDVTDLVDGSWTPGKSKLCTFNALLVAGPGGTRPDLLVLRVGCPCRQAAWHVKHHSRTYP
jgi:hypothetical protein